MILRRFARQIANVSLLRSSGVSFIKKSGLLIYSKNKFAYDRVASHISNWTLFSEHFRSFIETKSQKKKNERKKNVRFERNMLGFAHMQCTCCVCFLVYASKLESFVIAWNVYLSDAYKMRSIESGKHRQDGAFVLCCIVKLLNLNTLHCSVAVGKLIACDAFWWCFFFRIFTVFSSSSLFGVFKAHTATLFVFCV